MSIPAAPSSSSTLTTAKFSKLRQGQQRAATLKTSTSTVQLLTFHCDVMLMNENGKTSGTCIPAFRCDVALNDQMDVLVDKVMEELNSEDSQWRKVYGDDAVIAFGDICLTFKQKITSQYSQIKPRNYGSVRQFWDMHTQRKGLYFSEHQIKHFSPAIGVLVPISCTRPRHDAASDDNGDHDRRGRQRKTSRKRKERLSDSASPPPIKKEKLDDGLVEVKVEVKEEPIEPARPRKQLRCTARRKAPLVKPSSKSSPLRPITLHRAITFFCEQPVLRDGTWSLQRSVDAFQGKLHIPLAAGNSSRVRELLVDDDASVLLGAQCFNVYNSTLDAAQFQVLRLAKLGGLLSEFMTALGKQSAWFLDIEVPNHFIALELEDSSEVPKTVLDCCPNAVAEELSGNLAPEIHAEINDLTVALSHYTFHSCGGDKVYASFKTSITEGGAKLQIYDPVIHSISGDEGPQDQGPDAILAFKLQHACSGLCSKLKLQPFV
ncbi:uncharacterized protein C8Q71DRAFT_746948 [Rhodofomes roseus]|uniref:Alpha-type protein kinase domain-containing protein n=1 Tax=Rhodofomes roseus TaxID=34475 RepID=A0ABQ8KM79_9APHY|nr:uncharacterized protein C8Q71DRAFT_746948 [Rhodofomes roseus]KAH9838970.1 hypothetical protein C8Q71DRAFT_746948 [Rhodofomes roseus]